MRLSEDIASSPLMPKISSDVQFKSVHCVVRNTITMHKYTVEYKCYMLTIRSWYVRLSEDIASSPLMPERDFIWCTAHKEETFSSFLNVGVVGAVTKARPAGVAGQLGAGNCHNTSEKTTLCWYPMFFVLWYFGFGDWSFSVYWVLEIATTNQKSSTLVIGTLCSFGTYLYLILGVWQMFLLGKLGTKLLLKCRL